MDAKGMLFHIRNTIKRNEFIHDVPGEYIITNLELDKISEYDFNDGNTYNFQNCLLKDVNLNFQNVKIVFDNCILEGCIHIHNKGIGEEDTVILRKSQTNEELEAITIISPSIILYNNNIAVSNNISLTADECDIIENDLESPSINISYNSSCNIKDSDLSFFNIVDYDNLTIERSTINGRYTEKISLEFESKGPKKR